MVELNVENLTVSYGAVAGLTEVSMTARSGEITVVLGANGAGKSSLVNAVCGIAPVVAGSITLGGERLDVLPTESRTRRGVALSPEGRRVFPDMTVQENLLVGSWTSPRRRREREAMVFTYFPRLSERAHQAAGTLSGGEQQMLAIGRAMMSGPSMLVLDEPSLGLAPVIVEEIAEIIVRLASDEGVTVLLSEQNAALGLHIAQHGYVLQLGRVVASGTSDELEDDAVIQHAYLGG
ncbi:ABC transporter ATP-binding protein [Pseudactinotalea sp.]|uniref:ABC transporter ATP-binding protein n=1 Tax=Pseudactinotalea sp. TaxID=1926260 RepID=UPI003B3B0359